MTKPLAFRSVSSYTPIMKRSYEMSPEFVLPLRRWLPILVVVGILVSSFIALFTLRHHVDHPISGGPQMSSTDTTTGQTPQATNQQSTFITVVASDGTVYALQPESGKVFWQYATHQEVDMMVLHFGIS